MSESCVCVKPKRVDQTDRCMVYYRVYSQCTFVRYSITTNYTPNHYSSWQSTQYLSRPVHLLRLTTIAPGTENISNLSRSDIGKREFNTTHFEGTLQTGHDASSAIATSSWFLQWIIQAEEKHWWQLDKIAKRGLVRDGTSSKQIVQV